MKHLMILDSTAAEMISHHHLPSESITRLASGSYKDQNRLVNVSANRIKNYAEYALWKLACFSAFVRSFVSRFIMNNPQKQKKKNND